MNSQRKPSRQEILRRQQQSTFVGREDQLATFRHNLNLSPEDWRFLFNVSGQGGIGKSSLIRQFRKIAEEVGFITAYTSESENSVPEVMGRLAEQLEQQGYKLSQFSERYKLYRQKKQELEADPDAPQGFSAFLGRSLAKAGLGLAKQVPGSGAVTPFLDEEMIATQAGEWTAYVARKLGNKDEVRLVQEPVEVLSPLFLQDIGKVAKRANLALFCDTYERTSDFLDSWIREILEGRYGDLPINVIVVIAGREELSRNDWADYEGSIARLPLELFSGDEARQYLIRKGVTNPQVVDVILRLSGCLPLLVATLAVESPNAPDQIGDPSGTAVERFLKWVDDPKRRQVALNAALPRCLNRDIIAVLQADEDADELFNWLKQMPFVKEHPDGWVYHDIVRTQMLRHKRLTSPQGWSDVHRRLVDHYATLSASLELEEGRHYINADWQQYTLNLLYHRLCHSSQKNLSFALNGFLFALEYQPEFAEYWATILRDAGQVLEDTEIQRWGEQLVSGLKAYDEEHYEIAVEMFVALLNYPGIETQVRPFALRWKGVIYKSMKRYEDALKEINQAIEFDSNYKSALSCRGMIYRRMNCSEEALKDFERVIKLNPNSDTAIASRAYAYRLMRRYEEALVDLNYAIELNCKFVWALYLRGRTYRNLEQYDESLNDLNRAIELDPSYVPAIHERGLTYFQISRYEEAFKDFDRAIELDSNNSSPFSNRGWKYMVLGQFNKALVDFNHANEISPDDDWYLYKRALAYQVLNQSDNAKADLNRAIQLAQQEHYKNPENYRNTFNLALYSLVANDINQAKYFYREALNRAAPIPSIQEAIQALENFLKIFSDHKWAKMTKEALVLQSKMVKEQSTVKPTITVYTIENEKIPITQPPPITIYTIENEKILITQPPPRPKLWKWISRHWTANE